MNKPLFQTSTYIKSDGKNSGISKKYRRDCTDNIRVARSKIIHRNSWNISQITAIKFRKWIMQSKAM